MVSLPFLLSDSELFRELEELEILLFEKVPEASCLDSFVWTSHASIGFSVSTC